MSVIPPIIYQDLSESKAKMVRLGTTSVRRHEMIEAEAAGHTLPAADQAKDPAFDERCASALKIIGRALRVKDLSRADNYLRLCSDMRRTIIVIREIDKHFGIQLPLTFFMEAETIGAIVDAIAARSVPPSTGIVTLKAGEDGSPLPPLFVLPGLGGAVMELTEVARSLRYAGPVYGLPYPGLDGQCLPSSTIAPLANDTLDRMKSLQPAGPYLLLGYSAGGNVAIETARLINDGNQSVAFLGVIEPAVHERSVPFSKWLPFMVARMRQGRGKRAAPKDAAAAGGSGRHGIIGTLCTRSAGKISGVAQKLARVLARFRHRYGSPLTPGYAATSPYYIGNLPSLVQSVRDMSIVFLARYRFRAYDGKVIYFRSEIGDPLACEPHVIWQRYLANLHFEQTPGDHATMIAPPHAQILAARISGHLPHPRAHAVNNN